MRAGTSAGALAAAGKWFTAILTTFAAIAALLVNAQNLGLTSWLGASDIGFAGHAARRIIVTPRSDSLLAIGDTAVLAATVTDRRGGVLVGAPLTWSSDDTTVVAADTSGAVIARGPGIAHVTVAVREHRASATLIVRQRIARIVIGGDSSVSLPESDSTRLGASILDARGHRIRGAGVSWSSSDTFAVTVDSSGRAFSRAPGRATVVASAGGMKSEVRVVVQLTSFRLALDNGGGQHALTGRALAGPITVQALSRGGLPVPNVDVGFFPEEGAVDTGHVRTDARGRASVTWTLGPRPGRQALRSRIAGIDSVVLITAEADPSPTATRIVLADSAMSGTAGTMLNPPVILRLTDLNGLPLSDVPVGWSAFDGGSVIPLAPRTDSLGQVIARWTLGGRVGRQRIKVEVGDARSMPAFTVTAVATAGAPASVTVTSGAGQRATVGKVLAQPIVLAVRDSFGNPVAGAGFTAHPSTGSLADSTPVTDANGRLVLRWTAGAKPGPARLTIRSTQGSVAAEVTAQVEAVVVKKVKSKAGVPPAIRKRAN